MLISIIIPCYNEELVLPYFYETLITECDLHPEYEYEFLFINDGSTDNTSKILNNFIKKDQRIHIFEFSRNFGKESALAAGLKASKGHVVIPLDADLQHPPHVLFDLVHRYEQGDVDVVIALRKNRNTESLLYKTATSFFYRLEALVSECEMPRDAGDFRLMSREVVDCLCALPEKRLFMKGLYAWVGFRSASIDYDIATRVAGDSKFSFTRLLTLAANGILDFSTFPLRVWLLLGSLLSLLSFLYALWIIIKTLFWGTDLPGYASIVTFICFLGGIQMISIGVIGEYIGRLYSEVKGRPSYIIRKDSKI